MREVVWLGDSKKRLKAFPKDVQKSMGDALAAAQFGRTAENVKPFKHVGSGVFEIVERYKKNAYRIVYAVQIGEKIYVLHAFQKKSKPDIDLINQRYKQAQELAEDEEE